MAFLIQLKDISSAFNIIGDINLVDVEMAWKFAMVQVNLLSTRPQNTDYRHLLITMFDENATFWLRILSAAANAHYSNLSFELQRKAIYDIEVIFSMQDPVINWNSTSMPVLTIYVFEIILKSSQPASLISYFVNSSLKVISQSFNITSTIKIITEKDNESPALRLLSYFFSAIFHSKDLLNSIYETSYEILLNLLVKILIIPSSHTRDLLIRRSVSPLLKIYIENESNKLTGIATEYNHLVLLVWTTCLSLYFRKDYLAASSLLCSFITVVNTITLSASSTFLNPIQIIATTWHSSNLWQLVLHCFHHSDPTLRKRAAFILQSMPLQAQSCQHPHHSSETASPYLIDAIAENNSHLKRTGSNSKKGNSSVPLSPSLSNDQKNKISSNSSSSSSNTNRLWWNDYLDIYHQAEGCSSLHLVNQAWPLMERLCCLACDLGEADIDLLIQPSSNAHNPLHSDDDTRSNTRSTDSHYSTLISSSEDMLLQAMKSSSSSSSSSSSVNADINEEKKCNGPKFSFSWIRVLFRLLLKSQIPSIRKTCLFKILSGQLRLAASTFIAEWITSELFQLVDYPLFFSTGYIPPGTDIGIAAALTAPTAILISKEDDFAKRGGGGREGLLVPCPQAVTSFDALAHPGILMPRFLASMISLMSVKGEREGERGDLPEGNAALSCLLRGIIASVCSNEESTTAAAAANGTRVTSMSSMSAMRWVMRTFACKTVDYLGYLPRCFTICELKLIRNFVKEKLACCNNAVRYQVLLGLSPLFLCCVDPRAASSAGGDGGDGLPLLLAATEEIGWRQALRAGVSIGHLLRVAVSAYLHRSDPGGLPDSDSDSSTSPHRPEDFYLLVKAASLFSPSDPCSPNDSTVRGGGSSIAALQNQMVAIIQRSAGLGSSPYTSMDTQRSVLFLTSGFSSVLQLVASNRKLAGGFLGLCHLGRLFVKYLDDVSGFLVSSLRDKVLYEDATSIKVLVSLADVQVGWSALGGLLLLPVLDLVDDGAALDTGEGRGTGTGTVSSSLSYDRLLLTVASLLGELLDNLSANSRHTLELTGIGILLLVAGLLQKISSAWTMILTYVAKVTRTNTCQVTYELLFGVLIKTCITLISLPSPSSATFLAAQSEYGVAGTSSSSSSLTAAILAGCGHFGRLSALVMTKRWNAFRLALEMLTALKATVSRDDNIAKLSGGVQSQRGAHRLDGQLATHGAEILRLVMDQLDVAATDSIPDILATAALACKYALEADHLEQCDANNNTNKGSSERDNVLCEINKMLLVAWQAVLGTNEYSPESLGGFVLLLTSPILLTSLEPDLLADYFEKIFVLSCADRPSLLQLLVRKLCDAWGNNPSAMFPFILTFVPKVLLHREYIPDDHSISNWGDESNDEEEGRSKESLPVRITVLSLLENLDNSGSNENDIIVQQAQLKQSLQSLILHLLQMNVNGELSKTIILGSEKFGIKLRIWQALCVLSKYLDEQLLRGESEGGGGGGGGAGLVFLSLRHNCPHAIRVHMELFTAEICRRFPRLVLPTLLDGNCLNVFNHPQQTLSSYFVLLGHVVYSDKEDDVPARAANARSGRIYTQRALSETDCLQIVDSLLPWLTCVSGLPRAIAQLLGYELIPRVITVPERSSSKVVVEAVNAVGRGTETSIATVNATGNTVVIEEGKAQLLYSIWKFLDTNIEVIKLRSKQILFFSEFELRRKLTVQGLLDLPLEVSGERVAVHILTLLGDAVKAQKHEKNASKKDGSDSDEDNVESTSSTATSMVLQSKRIPFDDLHLNLPFLSIQEGSGGSGLESALESMSALEYDGGLNRHSGISARKRQKVIVCASLLGKITNLAGIARTCEVFAVEKLLLNSLSVIETDDFKGIAVSCGAWLPMEEVPEGRIPQYLRDARAKGYVVVGLEQADGSKALGAADTVLPPKCVLLLGKEREGIPAELLAEIDICLEIPQFGVIRSLNVHVSAALAIWELTKRNLKSLS